MKEPISENSPRIDEWIERWEKVIVAWVSVQMQAADSGHGIDHVRRVVENAKRIGREEIANENIYMPAAWLHDCVVVPKNSPQRRMASGLAAESAERFLVEIGYPSQWIAPISQCILSHSFSAGIPCSSLEAQVVQDSDRLEAIGAIGLARCLMTGGAMGQRLYHPSEPFPIRRVAADNEQSVDHFFTKLLGLRKTMQTAAGRAEAVRRSEFLVVFLRQLSDEIGAGPNELKSALESLGQ